MMTGFPAEPDRMGLPLRAFMYTLDQIAYMLAIDEKVLRHDHLHYERRSPGPRPDHLLLAVDLTPEAAQRDWRVAERELIRWLRYKGFRVYTRSSL